VVGDALQRELEAHGVGLMVVFGSRATGLARPDSDLDVGVLHVQGRRFELRELAELSLALEDVRSDPDGPDLLRHGAIDLADLASPDAIFRFEVARAGQVVYADSPERWVEFVTKTLIDYDDIAPFIPMLIEGVERAALRQART